MKKILFSLLLLSSLTLSKTALIIGILGQDGRYLTDLLVKKNYKVHGLVRPNSNRVLSDLNLNSNVKLHQGDLLDNNCLQNILMETQPDEIYNLAAQTQVGLSFKLPIYTGEVISLGTLNLLNAVKHSNLLKTRIFLASSSEILGEGQVINSLQKASFAPKSPYGVAKLAAYWYGVNYRESYNIFVSNGILFNHESPYREERFVTKKVAKAVARIKNNLQEKLFLGNLDIVKDWGHAKDYVKAMWLILQEDTPRDFVINTGKLHSLREFVTLAFETVGINIEWQGKGLNEKGIDKNTKKILVEIDPKFFRPVDSTSISVNSKLINGDFNWEPKYSFEDIVSLMVKQEFKSLTLKGK